MPGHHGAYNRSLQPATTTTVVATTATTRRPRPPTTPPDLDCADASASNLTVRPPDPHGFDREGDGLGCESWRRPLFSLHPTFKRGYPILVEVAW